MKKNQKQSKSLTLLIVVLSIITGTVGGFFGVKALILAQEGRNPITEESDNSYTIRRNATDYQKLIYEQLITELDSDPRNDDLIAELVAKNYVADFYTWSNKETIQDVGGLQYVHNSLQKPVRDQAMDSFYNDMAYYLQQGTVARTLEVTDAQTSSYRALFTTVDEVIDDETQAVISKAVMVDSFVVSISWTYAPSTIVDITQMQNDAVITVIKDADGLYSIVEVADGRSSEN